MKNKNLILGLSAFVFAICTAFTTTTLAPTDAYVLVKNTPSGAWLCLNSGGKCDPSGTLTCQVRVVSTTYPLGIVVTGKVAGCTAYLKRTAQQESPIYFPQVVYDVCPTCLD